MLRIYKLVIVILLILPAKSFCQKTDSLVSKLDSLQKKDTVGVKKNNIKPQAYNDITRINVPVYFTLLWSDYKQQFSTPFTMKGQDWGKFAKFAVVAGALSFADEPIQKRALRLKTENSGISKTSNFITNVGGLYEGVALASFAAYGYIFNKEKMKTTSFLATQAYLTSATIETVVKKLAGRQRPSYYDPNHVEAEPKFRGPFSKAGRDFNGKSVNESFPSGHATVAFAAATVYAMEYRDKPIIPIIAYSAASLIGLSRITENKHWSTDVLVGAALGHLCGRQVVNNYHRYAKIQNSGVESKKKRRRGRTSLNMQYHNGVFLPGFTYTAM